MNWSVIDAYSVPSAGRTAMSAVGQGAFRYELIEDWAKLPAGWELSQVSPATDSAGNVFLFNRGLHPMIVLNSDGEFLASWENVSLPSAHGMHIDNDDNVWVTLMFQHVVCKYDRDGTLLLTLGDTDVPSNPDYYIDCNAEGAVAEPTWMGSPQVTRRMKAESWGCCGPFTVPTDVAIGPHGDIYCSDGYGNSRIHRFSSAGSLLQSWGAPGDDPGNFKIPHGIWVHHDGRVFVADRENDRVQIFSADGSFLDSLTGFAHPCDVFVDQDGFIFVAEGTSWNKNPAGTTPFIQIRSPGGELLSKFASPSGASAHRVWVDAAGSLYVNQNAYVLPQGESPILKYRRV
jgi:hypothetical protein